MSTTMSSYHARTIGTLIVACGLGAVVYAVYHQTPIIIPETPISSKTAHHTLADTSLVHSTILANGVLQQTLSRCIFRLDGVLQLKSSAFLAHSTQVEAYLNGRFYMSVPRSPSYPCSITLDPHPPYTVTHALPATWQVPSLVAPLDTTLRRLEGCTSKPAIDTSSFIDTIFDVKKEVSSDVEVSFRTRHRSDMNYYNPPLFYLLGKCYITELILNCNDVWQFDLAALFFSRHRRPNHVTLPQFNWKLTGLSAPAVALEEEDWEKIDTRTHLDGEELVGSEEYTRAGYSTYVAAMVSCYIRYLREYGWHQQYEGTDLLEPSDYFAIRIQEQLYDMNRRQVQERCRLVLEEDVEFDDEEGLKFQPFEKIQEQAVITTTFLLAIHSQQVAASDYDRHQMLDTGYDWHQFIDIRPRHWSTTFAVSLTSSSRYSSSPPFCGLALDSTDDNTPLRLSDSDPETSADEVVPSQQTVKKASAKVVDADKEKVSSLAATSTTKAQGTELVPVTVHPHGVRTPPGFASSARGSMQCLEFDDEPSAHARGSIDPSLSDYDGHIYDQDGFLMSSSPAHDMQEDENHAREGPLELYYHTGSYQESIPSILHLEVIASALSSSQIDYGLHLVENQIEYLHTPPGLDGTSEGLHTTSRIHRPVPLRPFHLDEYKDGSTRTHTPIDNNKVSNRAYVPTHLGEGNSVVQGSQTGFADHISQEMCETSDVSRRTSLLRNSHTPPHLRELFGSTQQSYVERMADVPSLLPSGTMDKQPSQVSALPDQGLVPKTPYYQTAEYKAKAWLGMDDSNQEDLSDPEVAWSDDSESDDAVGDNESDAEDDLFSDNNYNTRSKQFQLFGPQRYILRT